MRLIRRLTDFRSDYRDTFSLWILLLFRCYLHSSLAAYRLFEIALRQHSYSRAEVICRLSSKRYGHIKDVISMQCILSCKAGELDNGFSLLDKCLKEGDFRALERLLFRTGSRPTDLNQRFLVLDRIAEHQDVLFSHRCYARIAQSYQVLKLEDHDLATNLIPQLQSLIAQLEGETSVGCCEESNRKNRAKMLVSLCTVSYHIALLLKDESLLFYSWEAAQRLYGKISFHRLNSDACLRMSSNLSRCLSIGLLLSPSFQEVSCAHILNELADLEASVISYCLPAQSGQRYPTQENHLNLMANLQSNLKIALDVNQKDIVEAIAQLSQLLNHSSSKSLTALIEQRFYEVVRA